MDDGTRTHDDRDHNPGLYQLSYAHHYRYRTKKLFRVDQRSSFNIAAGHRSSNTSSLKINSHRPIQSMQSLQENLARPAGLEPATSCLEGKCSIQLSYGRSQLLIDTPEDRLVGADGFEPPTLCSQSRCATRLRHAPMPGRHIVASSLRTAEAGPGGGTIIRPPPGPVNLPVPFFA